MSDDEQITTLEGLVAEHPDTLIGVGKWPNPGWSFTLQKSGYGWTDWRKSCLCCAPVDVRHIPLPVVVLWRWPE